MCHILSYVVGVVCVVSYPRWYGECVWYLTLGGSGGGLSLTLELIALS